MDFSLSMVKSISSKLISVLHSISSTNVKEFLNTDTQVAQASLLLKPDGRILTDITIIKPLVYTGNKFKVENDYLMVRAPLTAMNKLSTHIKRYCFKRKADVDEINQSFDHVFLFVG